MLMGCYALSEVKLTSHFIMALHDYMYNPMTNQESYGCDLCEDDDEDIYFGWYPDSGAMPMPMPGDEAEDKKQGSDDEHAISCTFLFFHNYNVLIC